MCRINNASYEVRIRFVCVLKYYLAILIHTVAHITQEQHVFVLGILRVTQSRSSPFLTYSGDQGRKQVIS